jgi:ribose 1,5-bisphosphate isomerase
MVHDDVRKVVDDFHIRQTRSGTVITHAALRALRSASQKSNAKTTEKFLEELEEDIKHLATMSPASITLSNGLRQVLSQVQQEASEGTDLEGMKKTVSEASEELEGALVQAVEKIAEIGARRLRDGDVIMTHS